MMVVSLSLFQPLGEKKTDYFQWFNIDLQQNSSHPLEYVGIGWTTTVVLSQLGGSCWIGGAGNN